MSTVTRGRTNTDSRIRKEKRYGERTTYGLFFAERGVRSICERSAERIAAFSEAVSAVRRTASMNLLKSLSCSMIVRMNSAVYLLSVDVSLDVFVSFFEEFPKPLHGAVQAHGNGVLIFSEHLGDLAGRLVVHVSPDDEFLVFRAEPVHELPDEGHVVLIILILRCRCRRVEPFF